MRTLVALAACALAGCAATPPQLQPDAGQAHLLTVPARGVQIYECRPTAAGGHAWAFVAPDAQLLDARGQPIGRHGAGPSWQANDGSRIVGSVKARADAPVAGAVPWLLLEARSDGPSGAFSKVTSIQRVNTTGGVAPADGCTGESVHATARVPYTADYRFFGSRE
jgi:hypothetical protein